MKRKKEYHHRLPRMLLTLALICMVLFVINDMLSIDLPTKGKTWVLLMAGAATLLTFLPVSIWGSVVKQKGFVNMPHFWILFIAFLGVMQLHLGSWHQTLAPNGDNAEYIISAKSLVEKGAIYRLHSKTERLNTLASPGLPLQLSPIYAIWGVDIPKMKWLIMLMALPVFWLLKRIFSHQEAPTIAAMLALAAATSPYLIANSTRIMTETPYLLSSLLTLLCMHRYLQQPKALHYTLLIVLTGIMVSYSFRALGVALYLSMALWLTAVVVRNRWSKENRQHQSKETIRKWLLVCLLPLILISGWQAWQSLHGTAQVTLLWRQDLITQFTVNLTALHRSIGQLMLSTEAFRWYQMLPGHILPPTGIGWVMAQGLLLLGVIQGIHKQELQAYYVVVFLFLLLLASQTPQEMVIMRYVSVILPFLIYYLFKGVTLMLQILTKTWTYDRERSRKSFAAIFSVMLLGIHVKGNMTNLSNAREAYGPYYQSFIEAAKWCGNNLPEDAYIMSIKPRIVYLYANRKGTTLTSDRDHMTEGYIAQKLEQMKRSGVTHLIVDVLSQQTQDLIYPLIQNNPELFEPYDIPELDHKCTVLRFLGN